MCGGARRCTERPILVPCGDFEALRRADPPSLSHHHLCIRFSSNRKLCGDLSLWTLHVRCWLLCHPPSRTSRITTGARHLYPATSQHQRWDCPLRLDLIPDQVAFYISPGAFFHEWCHGCVWVGGKIHPCIPRSFSRGQASSEGRASAGLLACTSSVCPDLLAAKAQESRDGQDKGTPDRLAANAKLARHEGLLDVLSRDPRRQITPRSSQDCFNCRWIARLGVLRGGLGAVSLDVLASLGENKAVVSVSHRRTLGPRSSH